MDKVNNLLTAQELEELLGKKYFYRQSIYRLAEDNRITSYQVEGVLYFSTDEVVRGVLKKLAGRLANRFPRLSNHLRVKFDENEGKLITVFGFPNSMKITVNTESETEEDLLNKIELFRKEVIAMPELPVREPHEDHDHAPHDHEQHGGPEHHDPKPHHREMIDALRRIEDRLVRIEEKLG